MSIQLRPATADDARLLFDWANDPVVRKQSFQSDPIDWDGHLEWLKTRLASTDTAILIACQKDRSEVGVVRFERDANRARLSYSISALYRGRKLATPMVAEGVTLAWARWDDLQVIEAAVRPDNSTSIRVLERVGFRVAAEDAARVLMALPREA